MTDTTASPNPTHHNELSSVFTRDEVEALAAEARAIAQRAGDLAARIEDLALDFEQRMEVVASETKKLRQLQELLRSIA